MKGVVGVTPQKLDKEYNQLREDESIKGPDETHALLVNGGEEAASNTDRETELTH